MSGHFKLNVVRKQGPFSECTFQQILSMGQETRLRLNLYLEKKYLVLFEWQSDCVCVCVHVRACVCACVCLGEIMTWACLLSFRQGLRVTLSEKCLYIIGDQCLASYESQISFYNVMG